MTVPIDFIFHKILLLKSNQDVILVKNLTQSSELEFMLNRHLFFITPYFANIYFVLLFFGVDNLYLLNVDTDSTTINSNFWREERKLSDFVI